MTRVAFVAATDPDAIKRFGWCHRNALRPVTTRGQSSRYCGRHGALASHRAVAVAGATTTSTNLISSSIATFSRISRPVRRIRPATLAREGPAAERLCLSGSAYANTADTPGSTKVLREFTRVFTAGLDVSRTLETFADAVIELLRPARLALLLPGADGRAYRVRVHRGLTPQIAESVRLPADGGLCHWLTVEGRPARA